MLVGSLPLPVWLMLVTALLLGLPTECPCDHTNEPDDLQDETTEVETRTREETTVLCLPRKFTFTVVKNAVVDNELLLCNQTLTVTSCYGRCESSEIPDYEVPYKISYHPVCTYGERQYREVRLTNCDLRHPNPIAMIPEAMSCSCLICDSYSTNCETLT